MRLQQELASNDDTENVENEEGNVRMNKPSSASKQHEPLCLQVQRNFKLRASDEKPIDNKPRKLTRPVSPNFQMVARLKLKAGSHGSISDTNSQSNNQHEPFKAIPFKKSMFERQASLPPVEKRQQTSFDAFNLSQSNQNIASKTLREYQEEI